MDSERGAGFPAPRFYLLDNPAVRTFVAIVAGLIGACVGSFLNVVVHRVPRGESIVKPASRCPACGTAIRFAENIPVVSWLYLRGRCRSCRVRIAARYPVVEAATAALWAACAFRFGSMERAALAALAVSVLITLSAIDLEHRRLPNVIVLPSTACALVWVAGLGAATGDLNVFTTAVGCGAAAFALLFLIAIVSGGMGFGDVKLAAFIGVTTGRFGWEVTVAAIFGGFFVGGLVAIVLLLAGRKGRKEAIPFGPALAAGATLALFAGPAPVRAWLGL